MAAAKRKAKNLGGRPLLPIPEDKVLTLARYGLTNVAIAAFFECDESVIRKRFAAKIDRARAERKAKLFERQWQKAMAGDTAMLIWLGKQEGQTDKTASEVNTSMTIKINRRPMGAPKGSDADADH